MKPVLQSSHSWKILSVVFFVIALLGIGTSIYQYYLLQNVASPEYQEAFVEKETRRILSKVGEIYALPSGIPQIAIVSNPEELKKWQPFFEKASVDDRILIYPDQAILYRPSTHQIINIGPVNRTEPDGATSSGIE